MKPRVQVARSVRGRLPAGMVRELGVRVGRACRRLGSEGALTVRICDDTEIERLHLRTMGLQGPTDVLSFPGAPMPGVDRVLGDIVVSWDAVVRQSSVSTPSAWLEELTQLVVHGLAHLHGHDHATRAQGRSMLRVERRAARAARAGPIARPYA